MKLKLADFLWIFILLLILLILVFNQSRDLFIDLTTKYPYLMGFIKTAILATMGELLAARILTNHYRVKGIQYKFIIWGLIGCSFVLVFQIFASGVTNAQIHHLLPYIKDSTLLFAFLTSTIMNLIFAPTFMAFHRITDMYIELGDGKFNKIRKIKGDEVLSNIDWNHFIKFIVLKTIPFFWIPAHTITFCLGEEYRVLMAAFLSIALGIILSTTKRNKRNPIFVK